MTTTKMATTTPVWYLCKSHPTNLSDGADGLESASQDGKDVVAEVAGDLGLDVMEADEFAA